MLTTLVDGVSQEDSLLSKSRVSELFRARTSPAEYKDVHTSIDIVHRETLKRLRVFTTLVDGVSLEDNLLFKSLSGLGPPANIHNFTPQSISSKQKIENDCMYLEDLSAYHGSSQAAACADLISVLHRRDRLRAVPRVVRHHSGLVAVDGLRSPESDSLRSNAI